MGVDGRAPRRRAVRLCYDAAVPAPDRHGGQPWEPEVLRLPIAPAPASVERPAPDDAAATVPDDGERPGAHVVVIDIS